MRAREFVLERDGKIGQRRQAATRGLNTFGDKERINGTYVLNRVMMAAAMADGTDNVIPMDEKSWVGKNAAAFPYTKEEQRMLMQAYRAAGANYQDLNRGDMDSEEHTAVNTTSPVQAFRGY